jgi:hypothetical protein
MIGLEQADDTGLAEVMAMDRIRVLLQPLQETLTGLLLLQRRVSDERRRHPSAVCLL